MAEEQLAPQKFSDLLKLLDAPARIDAIIRLHGAGVLHYGEPRKLLGLPANSEGTVLRRLLVRQENWAQTLLENAKRLRDPGQRASIDDTQIITAYEQLSDEIAGWSKQAREDTDIWE